MEQGLINGRWRVDAARRLARAGGGLPAFAAADITDPARAVIAVQIARRAPPRTAAIERLMAAPALASVLGPLDIGTAPGPDGAQAGFVICPAPPGPDLAAELRAWPEPKLIERVLKPLALALDTLRSLGVTHRAIRLDNVFAAADGPAVLGCAWAEPPGLRQTALFEPPGSAVCAPIARGEGRGADDVYALGVLLIVLALGRDPFAAMSEDDILRRKLALGSHAALTDGQRLSPALLELTRGMLAEDPEHRPPPALLRDPIAARARRVATRPPRRAHAPIVLGNVQIWHTGELALACAANPAEAIARLRGGEIDSWLRRALGDSALAVRLDEATALRREDRNAEAGIADALLLMQAVAVLDPLAPMCWRGLLLWPDAIGAMLAAGSHDEALADLLMQEAAGAWAGARPGQGDAVMLRIEGRQHRAILRAGDQALAMRRLAYSLNPLLPCASELVHPHWVATVTELLPALEQRAARAAPPPPPDDRELLGFLAARLDLGADDTARLEASGAAAPAMGLLLLGLLGRAQDRAHLAAMPALAGWLARLAAPQVNQWPNLRRRAQAESMLPDLIRQGRLTGLAKLLDNPDDTARDSAQLPRVRRAVRQIDDEIASLRAGRPARARRAGQLGRNTAAALGVAALAVSVAAALW